MFSRSVHTTSSEQTTSARRLLVAFCLIPLPLAIMGWWFSNQIVLPALFLIAGLPLIASAMGARVWWSAVAVSLFAVPSLILASSYFMQGAGVNDLLLYHLSPDLLFSGIGEHLLKILVALTVLVTGVLFLSRSPSVSRVASPSGRVLLILPALLLHPFTVDLGRYTLRSMQVAHETRHIASRDVPVEWKSEYRPVTSEPRRNLIVVYAEGLEETYWHIPETRDLVAPLDEWRQRSLRFTDVSSARGAGFTLGGIVSSSCGWPLSVPGNLSPNLLRGTNGFYPDLLCLTDILDAHGYAVEFAGGADLRFAGKGEFLEKHSVDARYGRQYFEQDENNEMSWWGLYDEQLFEFLKKRYDDLTASNEPFALLALTVDTHHPAGMASPFCAEPLGEAGMERALKCSSQAIASFLEYVRHEKGDEQTLIVLQSDHLAMRNQVTEHLDKADERRNLLLLNGEGIAPGTNDKPVWPYDIGATITDLLFEKPTLNLGISALSPTPSRRISNPSLPRSDAFSKVNAAAWGGAEQQFPLVAHIEGRMLTGPGFTFDLSNQFARDWAYTVFAIEDDALRLVGKRDTFSMDLRKQVYELWREGKGTLEIGIPSILTVVDTGRHEEHAVIMRVGDKCFGTSLPRGSLASGDEIRLGPEGLENTKNLLGECTTLPAHEGAAVVHLTSGPGKSAVWTPKTDGILRLRRGINLLAIDAENVRLQAHVDSCTDSVGKLNVNLPAGQYLAAIADTAWCKEPPETLLSINGTKLPLDLEFREVGVLSLIVSPSGDVNIDLLTSSLDDVFYVHEPPGIDEIATDRAAGKGNLE